ncbi:hypothetical protein GpartN1_g1388.t1 [Galdieria partita]|uniref:CCHC-type domain-containing protein n=1 Tax=Galdieria partita TaxID=83374 RepID=A0A9C7PTV1_9RHOD|nr:hypothetical protein GpartN1_g1388.t1 [Galdieria partita]
MAITTLFLSSFTQSDNYTSFKRNKLLRSIQIHGQVTKPGGSKRRVVFIEDPTKVQEDKATARKCSYCRQVGHNSRTCPDTLETSIFWTTNKVSQSTRDSNSFGEVSCQRCNNAGVVTCLFCEQDFDESLSRNDSKSLKIMKTEKSSRMDSFEERQLNTSTYLANLGRLSRMTYRLDGKTKVEVCIKCSGTTLMVCPRCRGEP